jgi:hypothetical protein
MQVISLNVTLFSHCLAFRTQLVLLLHYTAE